MEKIAFARYGDGEDGDNWFSSPSPSGSRREGYTTYEEKNETLVDAIRVYLTKSRWGWIEGYPKITVHSCWSGYSEWTVTAEWSEVQIDWGEHHAYFEDVSEFFKSLAEAARYERL